jgi:HK97 family phage portal protein
MESLRGERLPAVLGSGWKYERVSVPASESSFIESQHFTIEQICRVFGVPPEMIGHASGGGGSITYANIEERQIAFQSWTLLPWATRIEAALSSVLPRPQFVKLNLDATLRVSLLDRYKAHDMALRGGWRNVDEVRRLEDDPPIPNGDIFLWPPAAVSGGKP